MDAGILNNEAGLWNSLFLHLSAVEQSPADTLLDKDLLKRVEYALSSQSSPQNVRNLLVTGERLLQVLQQDPEPLTSLMAEDIGLIPFNELKESITPEKLKTGMNSKSTSIQLLCLAYLRKAASLPSGAGFVAGSSDLSKCLIELWLSSESTEVTLKAGEAIISLLKVDSTDNISVLETPDGLGEEAQSHSEAHGQGLFWRRIFNDVEVFEMFFAWTSLYSPKWDLQTKHGRKMLTLSQGRLLGFIAEVAQLGWEAINTSKFPELEERYHILETDGDRQLHGLVMYAGYNMIDEEDAIMEVLRQDLFVKLNAILEEGGAVASPKLLRTIRLEVGLEDQDYQVA